MSGRTTLAATAVFDKNLGCFGRMKYHETTSTRVNRVAKKGDENSFSILVGVVAALSPNVVIANACFALHLAGFMLIQLWAPKALRKGAGILRARATNTSKPLLAGPLYWHG